MNLNNLAFIALRIREHLIHAQVHSSGQYVLTHINGVPHQIRTWSDARNFLGY